MKSGLRQIFAFVPAILFSIIVPAQELPVMPDDPAVVAGTLPNGMSYYIAQNASDKGRADFALVQKTGRKNVADSAAVADKAVAVAREALPGRSLRDTFYFGRISEAQAFSGRIAARCFGRYYA